MDLFSLSTDQVAAFVALAECGSLRAAAEKLLITEQGLRNRLIALEGRLQVPLYLKARGLRRTTPLTEQGRRLLPKAIEFLAGALQLREMFATTPQAREVNVVGSQYLIGYFLLDAVKQFHREYPAIQVRLSARTERDIDQALLASTEYALGVAAPYEASADLRFEPLFSMNWSVIVPRRHRLGRHRRLQLEQLAREPLIVYERGSTGRQHVIEAFQSQALVPHVEMEATNTDLVVRMVEAGLGVALVPLLPSGVVTRGRRVTICELADSIRPIDSGLLFRRHDVVADATRTFADYVRSLVSMISGRKA